MAKTLVLNVVGLTPELLRHAPRLAGLGPPAPLDPPLPAVTSTCQATMLTGRSPREHGVVANGWYHRELNEVWFWRQSNRLIRAPKVYETANATCAVLFWWFNMAGTATWTVTPRPAYFADGRKLPDIYSNPPELGRGLQERLGTFPLFRFWGPLAGIESTRWIASAAIEVLERHDPELCLVYLPHLDYDLQRKGPDDDSIPAQVRAVDAEAGRILDAARGRRVLVVSEYGIEPVHDALCPNRVLRREGFLEVIDNPVGELLDPARSRAFAVCDHQVAHVYVREASDLAAVRALFENEPAVERVAGPAELLLDHPRAGELVLLASRGHWFAYPYWLDDEKAPDFARTVDIHRKPGYDPVELFTNASKARVAWILLKRKLGFRALLDVIPLDPGLVRGSHGRPPAEPAHGPLLLGDTDRPRPMAEVHRAILDALAG